ncbi:MAG: M14 family zinc carboxypeptidase, partial [Anaerolineae bacterium]|nr:M14 family zinc carboxypeptidase [Anaerolineae bacterium]
MWHFSEACDTLSAQFTPDRSGYPLSARKTWRAIGLLILLLLSALPSAAQDAGPGPRLYRVTLPAADREARSRLVRQGIAIDAVGPSFVVAIVDEAELATLRAKGPAPLAVSPLDFPPEDAAYHNYDEMMAELSRIAAGRPDIVALTTAGYSLEGRAIPAVKISDEPALDDPAEPAVLFMALTHAREHLTVEMALAIVRLFAEGHGQDPALTNLVEQREIYVLPNVNPDGGEYDIAEGYYRYWRKNRRPNPDGSYGVDLNRNYGYRWGCDGGSSPVPPSETYRGPEPFSEPETQAVRDFVISHPDITAAISFHTFGELILYPYGYTYDDLPEDMDPTDRWAFVALADQMAATNGYRPQQASDLYVTCGDTVDWLYGERGIFGFTFEMYPTSFFPGFYPPGAVIPQETARNFPAVTALTAAADNPRKVIGLGGDVTPPTATLGLEPPGPWLVSTPITLTATAGDDVGVTLVAWQANGVTIAMDRTPPFETAWTPDEPGLYRVEALAFDGGGNAAVSE